MSTLIYQGKNARLIVKHNPFGGTDDYVVERREDDELGGDRWLKSELHRQLRDGGAQNRTVDLLIGLLQEASDELKRADPRGVK